MRRSCMAFAFMAVVAVLCSPVQAEYKKTKVAVIDFQLHGEGYETKDMGKIVAEWLITALVRDGRFEVIERRLLEKILAEQKLSLSGILDESSASKLGLMLGAKVVISGSVMSMKSLLEVNARIIDVQTGSVIAAESVKSQSATGLEDMVLQMAKAIIRDFPLQGYVVRRNGPDVIIDLGRTSGIRSGMRFMVFKEGEVIKHPKTGEVLDVLMKETGRIEVVRVMDNTADALVVSEAGAGPIDYGQMVKSINVGDAPPPPPLPPPTQSPLPQTFRESRQRQPPEKPAKPAKPAKPEKPATSERTTKSRPQPSGDLAQRLAALEARVPELRALWLDRERNNNAWSDLLKQMRDEELKIYHEDRRNPQIFVLLARMYHAIEDSRRALDYTQDAIRLDERRPDLWTFRGDMILDTIMRLEPAKRTNSRQARDAVRAYEGAVSHTDDPIQKASLYARIGDVYADFMADQRNAHKFWRRAVEIAPDTESAQRAKERLR